MTTADIVAMLWTILAALFLGFGLNGLLIARGDRIEAEAMQDLAVIFVVESRERRQIIRSVGFGLFLLVGVLAMLPLPTGGIFSLITLAGLFVGMTALGLEDVSEQLDRARFRREIQRRTGR